MKPQKSPSQGRSLEQLDEMKMLFHHPISLAWKRARTPLVRFNSPTRKAQVSTVAVLESQATSVSIRKKFGVSEILFLKVKDSTKHERTLIYEDFFFL